MLPSPLSPSSLDRLITDGYIWLPRVVPPALCEKAAIEIARDVGRKLDAGSKFQEHELESLEGRTRETMTDVLDFVMRDVIQEGLSCKDARIPKHFTQTVYGRVKRKDFHTKWHCDALNTVFERRLLTNHDTMDEDLRRDERTSLWVKIETEGKLSSEIPWHTLPIFTFWVALRKTTKDMSLLRIHPQSHAKTGFELEGERALVKEYGSSSSLKFAPMGYKYKSSHFVGPMNGYEQGDVVLFHCLTLHEASPHRPRALSAAAATDTIERVSLDGRCIIPTSVQNYLMNTSAGTTATTQPDKRARICEDHNNNN